MVPKTFVLGVTIMMVMRRSKHLKGRFGPRVSDGNVFCTKGGQLGPFVGDATFFKVVSWFFMVFGWFPWFFKVVS